MIYRAITQELLALLKEYPVVTILGPRQAGKTTLARSLLEFYQYANLEVPETRQFAQEDPKGFLKQFTGKIILDEIQRVPELLSYIQSIVDEKKIKGQFVLTGSHQLALHEAVSQSLAGRTAILNLLPFSLDELANAEIVYDDAETYIYRGFLPRIYDQQQRPTQSYSNYFQTYVERDVRRLINLKDVTLFEKFMKLLAGRVGQLMDKVSLANDVGVSSKTISHWLSILEASFVIFKVPPYFENFGKRVIKSPKYYFVEPGLLAFLLGIETPQQISRDPLLGQMFENLVVCECLKAQLNHGKLPNLYFYRDKNQNEVDLLVQKGRELIALEIKAAATFNPKLVAGLKKMANITDSVTESYLIYRGEEFKFSDGLTALPFSKVGKIIT